MRILYILNTLAIGGAERLVVSLGERMSARGHEIEILTLREPAAEQWPTTLPVAHLGIDKNPLSAVRGIGRAMKVLRRFRPDILHSHNFHGNLFARCLKLTCPSVRVLSTLHNQYEGGRARMLSLRLTDRLSDGSVAVSEAVAERALQLRIVPPAKCQVVLNGIDVTRCTPDRARRRQMRAAQGAGDDFVWLTAGRITEAKDHPTLLRAFAQMYPIAPRTQLWIAGDGEAEYCRTLRILAFQLGVSAAVEWLGMRRDVAALLDAADGFVLASAWEGMPLALAEAMAMEKPAVASGVGGVSELLGSCGLVVPPRDPDRLARAMLSIANTPSEARQFLGQAARKRVAEHFNIEEKAREWERIYEDVIARHRA